MILALTLMLAPFMAGGIYYLFLVMGDAMIDFVGDHIRDR